MKFTGWLFGITVTRITGSEVRFTDDNGHDFSIACSGEDADGMYVGQPLVASFDEPVPAVRRQKKQRKP